MALARLGARVFRRRSSAATEPPTPDETTEQAESPRLGQQPSNSSPALRRHLGRATTANEERVASPSSAIPPAAPSSLPLPPPPAEVFNRNSPPKLVLEQASPDVQSEPSKQHGIVGPSGNHPKAPPTPISPDEPPPETSLAETEPVETGAGSAVSVTTRDRDVPPSQAANPQDYFGSAMISSGPNMARRKIWVKRPGASATTVQIMEDDLVDDVRDLVLRKYGNSLGKSFDAPDVTLRIVPREKSQQSAERVLNPEESICRTIESYFPGGQQVDEALLIDIPQKRTPRPSPRVVHPAAGYFEEHRPVENGNEYFPPMPVAMAPTTSHDNRHQYHQSIHPHSIAVLDTGQLPPLPSPRERKGHPRPKYPRQHTSSPTAVGSAGQTTTSASNPTTRPPRPRVNSSASNNPPTPPPLPTPPAPEATSKALSASASTPPLDQTQSPRVTRPKKPFKQRGGDAHVHRKNSHQLPSGLLDGIVPPINVLIVEDNIINLKLLEANVKRLKVRWQTAMNGRDAVTKWRQGGFHLVLMDIQLPIMNGLDATKEIRRLERLNGIGIFAKAESEGNATAVNGDGDGDSATQQAARRTSLVGVVQGEDKLPDEGLFKSPVIIVALTASSLQSDRHEALAAGCNDFLTKPVNKEWFERKVMEWGCMQALIDFDGWRQWKQEADEKQKQSDLDPSTKEKQEKKEARRAALLAKMGQT